MASYEPTGRTVLPVTGGCGCGMRYRKATEDDAQHLFDWRNDPDTCLASISTAPISWDTHLAWLRERLSRNEPGLYIAEVNDTAIGTFRIDGEEISYAIAPKFRGRGLALVMLKLVLEQFGSKIARVKKENAISARAAARAGHQVIYFDE